MRIAFYAPMKPPDHAVPSGDRTMAQLLGEALARGGHAVELASRLVTWSAEPDYGDLRRLEYEASAEAARLAARWRDGAEAPDVWFTYHLYHRAPDLVGPQVTADLGIPYVVVEASRAARRARDAWREHFRRADKALFAADAVAAVSRHDLVGLERALPAERLRLMPPFIDCAAFDPGRPPDDPAAREGRPVRLLAAGMMRLGRKADSYRVLADALRMLPPDAPAYTLTVAGDGPERRTVERNFAGLPATFLGRVPFDEMAAIYARHDVFAWPAIDEPYGLVFLEAQASGLPVIGSDARGVPDIVAAGETGLLPPSGDPAAFRDALVTLMCDAERRETMGRAARDYVRTRHDIPAATAWLDDLLADVTRTRERSA